MSHLDEEFKHQDSKEGFNQTISFDNTTKIKLDFPFDLNNLFNMNYSFDVLKQSIEFIARQQVDLRQELDLMKGDKEHKRSTKGSASQLQTPT